MRTKAAYPWPFFAAMAATLLLFLSFQGLFPTLPLYIAAIGGSPADNGLASWVFALAAVVTRPLAGSLADRWGRKPVLVLGAIAFGGGPLLYGLKPNVPWLLGVRAIHGVGMALFTTTYQAFIADLLAPGRYGEGLGLANTASVVTMVAAPPFGEWLVRKSGFELLFLALGALGGMGVVATLVLPGPGRIARTSSRSLSHGCPGSEHGSADVPSPAQVGLRHALRQPGVRVGTLGMALLGVPFGAFIAFLPLSADARGLGGTGWVFAAYALTSSLVQPVAGRISDRWGGGRTALAGLALVGVTAAGLAVAGSMWTLLGLAGLFGAGYGAARAGLDACVQGSVEPELRGSGAAVQYTAHDLLIGLGCWALGWLAGAMGYGVMYATVGGITLIGLVIGGLIIGWAGGGR
jgi:MFS family permease